MDLALFWDFLMLTSFAITAQIMLVIWLRKEVKIGDKKINTI